MQQLLYKCIQQQIGCYKANFATWYIATCIYTFSSQCDYSLTTGIVSDTVFQTSLHPPPFPHMTMSIKKRIWKSKYL